MAATYYVANAGADGNNGTSPATPFRTITHAQSVLAAGDTLLLNRGDRWFETLSLSQPNTITDAYGAAPVFDAVGYGTNAPILDEGNAVTGWSPYGGGVVPTFGADSFAGTSGTLLTSHTPNTGTQWLNDSHYTSAIVLTGSGAARANSTGNNVVNFAPTPSNADYATQLTVTFVTIVANDNCGPIVRANTGTSINFYHLNLRADGTLTIYRTLNNVLTALTSTTITVTAGTPYILKLSVVGTTLTGYVNGTQQLTTTDNLITVGAPGVYNFNSTAPTNTTGSQFSAFSVISAGVGTPVNTYQATLATQTWVVDHNQTFCFAGLDNNDLADQQYYWYGGVLYFRNDAGQPNNTEIVVGQRNWGVTTSVGLSGTTVRNIAVEHANQASYNFGTCPNTTISSCYGQRTSFWDGTHGQNGFIHMLNSNNAVVQDCVGRFIFADGIYFSQGTAPQGLRNIFYQLYGLVSNGITIEVGTPANGAVLRGNQIFFPSAPVGYSATQSSAKGGIICFSDNALIERNFVAYAPEFGITALCNGPIIRDNTLYHCSGGPFYQQTFGVGAGGGGIRFATNGGVNLSGHQVYRNLLLDCPTGIYGTIDAGHSITGLVIANNTVVNINVPPATQDPNTFGSLAVGNFQVAFVAGAGGGFGGTFENNLVYNFTGSGGALYMQLVSGTWTSDYNLFGPNAAGVFNWLGTVYATLAAYQAGASKDTHSISSLPTFSNQGYLPSATPTPTIIYDALLAYRCDWRSPARGAGTTVAGVAPQVQPPSIGIEPTYGVFGIAA